MLAAAGCADPEERSTNWQYLHATIIEPGCATAACHSATTEQAELDLSTPGAAYRSLVNTDCGEDPFAQDSYVIGIPQDPIPPLLKLLRGDFGGAYPQMPVDLPLADGEIRLIEEWIEEGALCQP